MIKTDMKGITRRGNSYTLTVACGLDGNGKQVRKYTTFKPPADVPRERADRLAMRAYEDFYNQCHRVENENGNMFFKELYDLYFNEYAQNELKLVTAEQYRKSLDKHIMPVFANQRLKAIKKRDVQSFLCNQPKLKGSTCRKLKTILSSVFSYAVDEGFIETNPCTGAKHKKDTYDISKFKYLTREQTLKLIEITKEYTQLNNIIRILLFTGMRLGELLSLTINDIDFEYNLIKVNTTLSYAENRWYIDDTKTKSSTRVIKVNYAIIDMLKKEMEEREKKKAFCEDAWVENGFIFTRPDGRCLDRTKINTDFKKLLAKNDLPSIHTHSLRHTFATLLINMGTDTKSVSTALGHSQTQITNDIYVHIFEEHSAKISNSLCDSLLNTATE